MGLRTYNRKRDFKKTPEPEGRSGRARKAGTLSYVIQRHHARRLHYDFRLEMEGVLRSWAVPKGPSFDPDARRLAVHTEDHPLSYGSFEGEIPQGEYGGGQVVLWDKGIWIPAGDPVEAHRRGRIKFELRGVKLAGKWLLVRMGGRSAEEGKENWLLIKERDEFARKEGDIARERPESVKGVRDRASASRRPGSAAPVPRLESLPREALPDFIEPQMATLVQKPPTGEEWIHEIKLDGYRILCRVRKGKARLLTRKGNDWTRQFPETAEAAARLPVRQALLDGEIAALDENGVSSFQSLQNAMDQDRKRDLVYFAFDLLHLDGRNTRGLPLLERKALLAGILPAGQKEAIRYSEHIQGRGEAFHRQACQFALEGIVSKVKGRPYLSGRTDDWVKVKCLLRQEFVVGGYTDPEGARGGFGALLLGIYRGGRLVYVGKVGTGFDREMLMEAHARLRKLETDRCPFSRKPPGASRRTHWVRPELVAEIQFSNWTEGGHLRQGSFQGFREDKDPREVVRERTLEEKTGETVEERKSRDPEVAGVRLTNSGRVLYPAQGITKLELARYYERVAEWILPHIAGRPLSVVRCPSGQDKHCFFQKHVDEGLPDTIRSVEIEEGHGSGRYLMVEDLPGLIGLVQIGALELHPWGCRSEDIEHPDRMVFDLDPSPEVPWPRVVEAAHAVRERLRDMNLECCLKTTGGKGLHVFVPLSGREDWDEMKAFSKALADRMAREEPRLYTSALPKAERKGKIFIDYLRNNRGSTSVAAYSTRAKPGAPVSVPIDWKELSRGVRSDSFNVRNLPERLEKLRRDPWSGLAEAGQSLIESAKEVLAASAP